MVLWSLPDDPEGRHALLTGCSRECVIFAQIKYDGRITKEVADFALNLLEVDKLGLDQTDRQILMTMIQKFGGGIVGLETLAVSIGEDPGTLEDVYEPYLVQNGLILRTPRAALHQMRRIIISGYRKNKT